MEKEFSHVKNYLGSWVRTSNQDGVSPSVGRSKPTLAKPTLAIVIRPTLANPTLARERYRAKTVHDSVGEDRVWKAFALVPMMLLNKPKGWGSVGRDELALRVDRFSRGEWLTLLEDARANMPKLRPGENSLDVMAEQQRRGKAAQSRVERGQVSRARQELTGAILAPKTDETLRELQGRRPQEMIRGIPVEVLNFVPGQAVLATFRSERSRPPRAPRKTVDFGTDPQPMYMTVDLP